MLQKSFIEITKDVLETRIAESKVADVVGQFCGRSRLCGLCNVSHLWCLWAGSWDMADTNKGKNPDARNRVTDRIGSLWGVGGVFVRDALDEPRFGLSRRTEDAPNAPKHDRESDQECTDRPFGDVGDPVFERDDRDGGGIDACRVFVVGAGDRCDLGGPTSARR